MNIINFEGLVGRRKQLKSDISSAQPFPFLVIDDFLEPEVVSSLNADFDIALAHQDPNAPKKHRHVKTKMGIPNRKFMTERQVRFFDEVNSPAFTNFLSDVTGVAPIYPDEDLNGGGLHQSSVGGYLNVHTDFNFHPKTHKHRRFNLIVYLNDNWDERWGGNLEIWDANVKNRVASIKPIGGRCVLFETSEISFHGHPEPLSCPDTVRRRSLAVYYYSDWPDGLERRERTNYQLTPQQVAALEKDVADAVSRGASTSKEVVVMLENWQQSEVINCYKRLTGR